MKLHVCVMLTMLIASCSTNPGKEKTVRNEYEENDTLLALINKNSTLTDEQDSPTYNFMETAYVIVADTSHDYYVLRQKMFDLNKSLNIPIDTMGRYFNRAKNLIALPDDDKDEMYAGDYFPRRLLEENLSLEYLSLYENKSGDKTIALVTGIYETENSADSALAILKRIEKNGFEIKTSIYTGCLH